MDEDPYESIITQCQITCSQEHTLDEHRRYFGDEAESSPSWLVQSTGIVMVTPPDSYKEVNSQESQEDDVFHTPPEQPHSQSVSGSEDVGPAAANRREVGKSYFVDDVEIEDLGSDCTDSEKTVDLGDDCDSLGFGDLEKVVGGGDGVIDVEYGEPVSKKRRVVGEGLEAESPVIDVSDTDPIDLETESVCCSEDTQVVNVGENCEEMMEENCEEMMDKRVSVDMNGKEDEIGGEVGKVIDMDVEENIKGLGEELKESTVNVDTSGKEAEVGCEVGKVIDMDVGENCAELGEELKERTVNVDTGGKEAEVGCEVGKSDNVGENAGEHMASKNIEDNAGHKRGMEGGGLGKRELPRSFKEPEKNEGVWAPRVSSHYRKPFKYLVTDVEIVRDDLKDTDLLEIAKEQGVVFPWPRWWPSEGFGGEGVFEEAA